MANPSTEAVIAGSKAFALALLAPLTERIGTRPRIASDPGQALAMCQGSGLVVVEFQGEGSLRAIQHLVVQGPGLRIIAAVPSAHAAAEGSLRALGVDLARWDGKPDLVLDAVGRRLGDAPPPAAPPPVEPATFAPPRAAAQPAAAVASAPPPRPEVGAGLFDDLAPEDDLLAAPPGVAAPSFVPGDAPWPGNAPGALDAAEALARGLAGDFDPPGAPLASVADVVASLTELERSVLSGAPQPVDTEPIRRAAVMRVRVAAALAIAPAPGAPVDPAAVSTLLAELDALIQKVNALAQATPPELQAAVEQVRNSLVKEAIDFSEAAHHAQAAPGAGAAPAAAPARADRTRVVAVASRAEVEYEEAQRRRRRTMTVLLAVSALGAAAYHGYRFATRPTGIAPPAGIYGAPANARALRAAENTPTTLIAPDGGSFSAEEMKRLVDGQALKGNEVKELAPGMVVILPQRAGVPAPAPAQAAPAQPPGAAAGQPQAAPAAPAAPPAGAAAPQPQPVPGR